MKISSFAFAIVAFGLLTSCAEDSQSESLPNHDGSYSTGNVTEVNSTNTYKCDETINGNTATGLFTRTDENQILLYKEEYILTDEVIGNYLDGVKINSTKVKSIVTLYTDDQVSSYNLSTCYGYYDWAKGVAKDVSGKNLDKSSVSSLYTIRLLENGTLYYGIYSSTYDGSTPEKRPTEFNMNFANPLRKQ